MDVKQIFSLIKRWLWLLILGSVIGAGIGYYISIRQTPIYQAQARFVILPAAQTTYDYYSYLNNQDLIDTYAQLLTTEELLYQASETLGFPVRKGQATAQQVDDTKFVVLTVKDPDPFKAATIANGLVEIMISQNENLQSVQFSAAEKNLQDRIDQAEEQIATLESQITQMSDEILQSQIESVQIQMDDVQAQVNNLKVDMAQIYPELLAQAEDSVEIDLESLTQEEIAQLTAYQTKLDEITPILELYQEIYTELVVLGQTSGTSNRNQTDLDRLRTTLNLYQQIYISSINNGIVYAKVSQYFCKQSEATSVNNISKDHVVSSLYQGHHCCGNGSKTWACSQSCFCFLQMGNFFLKLIHCWISKPAIYEALVYVLIKPDGLIKIR